MSLFLKHVSALAFHRSKSASDIQVDPDAIRKVRYEELQKYHEQVKQSEDKWQDVSLAGSSCGLYEIRRAGVGGGGGGRRGMALHCPLAMSCLRLESRCNEQKHHTLLVQII